MIRIRATLTQLLLASLLAGCATWLAPLSTAPVDRDHGWRTLGARIEDESIERKVLVNVRRSSSRSPLVRLVAVSWNGQLLLTGQVPEEGSREKILNLATKIRHVRQIHDELVIGPPITPAVRMSDGWITLRIKTGLLFGADLPARRVKVLTENGVVYLMGLLTREEATAVVDAARVHGGVQKIVKIFEYIEPGADDDNSDPATPEHSAGTDPPI